MSTSPAAREARLRRAAKRQGYRLSRSRWRAGSIDNAGGFQVIDLQTNVVVAGSRFDLDADDVQRWLAE